MVTALPACQQRLFDFSNNVGKIRLGKAQPRRNDTVVFDVRRYVLVVRMCGD